MNRQQSLAAVLAKPGLLAFALTVRGRASACPRPRTARKSCRLCRAIPYRRFRTQRRDYRGCRAWISRTHRPSALVDCRLHHRGHRVDLWCRHHRRCGQWLGVISERSNGTRRRKSRDGPALSRDDATPDVHGRHVHLFRHQRHGHDDRLPRVEQLVRVPDWPSRAPYRIFTLPQGPEDF